MVHFISLYRGRRVLYLDTTKLQDEFEHLQNFLPFLSATVENIEQHK